MVCCTTHTEPFQWVRLTAEGASALTSKARMHLGLMVALSDPFTCMYVHASPSPLISACMQKLNAKEELCKEDLYNYELCKNKHCFTAVAAAANAATSTAGLH